MTLKKKSAGERSLSYDTFEDSAATGSSNSVPQKSDKSKAAGDEAQRLASQGFWREDYEQPSQQPAGSTSPAMGNAPEVVHPYQDDPRDPPPIYTPSDTTATSTPPSPVAARAQPHQVGDPPSQASASQSIIPEGDEARNSEDGSYASSPLLERAETHPTSATSQSACHWHGDAKMHKRRRFKKACWFTFALVLCLWLMIPGIMNDKAGTRGPGWHHRPDNLDQSPVPAYPFPDREYRRHERSSSITGTFKLFDLLELSTVSGSIVINIEPQPGDKPAVLRLSSKSGSIRVQMGKGIIPWLPSSHDTNRTFDTQISAQSGSVSGSLLAGNGGTTRIETRSGSISMDIHILDLGPSGQTSKLGTYAQSGSQALRVMSSASSELRNLEAEHIAYGSASFKIDYPKKWYGQLHMVSQGSGSMMARGDHLDIVQRSNREIYAYRGEGKDLKQVEIIGEGSGSAVFSC